jgi:hypothetical protein
MYAIKTAALALQESAAGMGLLCFVVTRRKKGAGSEQQNKGMFVDQQV